MQPTSQAAYQAIAASPALAPYWQGQSGLQVATMREVAVALEIALLSDLQPVDLGFAAQVANGATCARCGCSPSVLRARCLSR